MRACERARARVSLCVFAAGVRGGAGWFLHRAPADRLTTQARSPAAQLRDCSCNRTRALAFAHSQTRNCAVARTQRLGGRARGARLQATGATPYLSAQTRSAHQPRAGSGAHRRAKRRFPGGAVPRGYPGALPRGYTMSASLPTANITREAVKLHAVACVASKSSYWRIRSLWRCLHRDRRPAVWSPACSGPPIVP